MTEDELQKKIDDEVDRTVKFMGRINEKLEPIGFICGLEELKYRVSLRKHFEDSKYEAEDGIPFVTIRLSDKRATSGGFLEGSVDGFVHCTLRRFKNYPTW